MQNKDKRVEVHTNFIQIMRNAYDHVKDSSFVKYPKPNRVNAAY